MIFDSLDEGLKRPAAGLAFGAGEGDVGMEGAGLGRESADGCGGADARGEGDQRGSRFDIGEEDAGTVEEGQFGEMDGNGGGVDFMELRDEAAVRFRIGVAQKLKRDVP